MSKHEVLPTMSLKPKPFKNSDEAKEPCLKRRRDNATYSSRNNKEIEKKEDNEESTSSSTSDDAARKKVRIALGFFRLLVNKPSFSGNASQTLEKRGKFVHEGKKIIGKVPGIEVGDEFQYWEQLNVVGLHRQSLSGIDHVIHNEKLVATSVVTCLYDDDIDDKKILIYTGEGSNVTNYEKEAKGNLALKNSFDVKSPVRVINKFNLKNENGGNRRGRVGGGGAEIYRYFGLYKVDKFRPKIEKSGYKFCLVKLHNQLKESKHIIFDEDVSKGTELVPISMVNEVDYEKVPFFRYINQMIYPKWCNPVKGPFVGCTCAGECSYSVECFCALKNEGEIPFNKNKTIMATKKDMIYECGPYCKCSSSCRNRVGQNGIKFKLQIFKTKTKGWGVRSHKRIPAGSFICEYLGEIIEDKEAVKMIDNDEYLFNLGNNLNGNVYGNYTINADHYGNVARFINHSCSPNLFCQRVLYDHGDDRIPHIMLFAGKDIPKMQELTFNYHYKIDQVIDSNGNVKKKNCYCGALECCGRLY